MSYLKLAFPVILIAQAGIGKELPKGKLPTCQPRQPGITEIMHPAVIAAAFYNPSQQKHNPSVLYRAILTEPSSQGGTIYVEKVNFAEPDLVEWQNSFSNVNLEELGLKAQPGQSTEGIWPDYLQWKAPNFEFGLTTANGDEFVCTIAPEPLAKPKCSKKVIIKGD